MGREKVQRFSAPGSKTSCIPLQNPGGVTGGEVEGQPGARGGSEGAEGEYTKWAEEDKRFEDEGGAGVQD